MARKANRAEVFRRPRGRIQPRACVLIVCEGDKTEPNYFESLRNKLRLSTVEVAGKGFGSAAISVVDAAIELRSDRKRIARRSPTRVEYDSVWCVFDVEAPKDNTLDNAFVKARDNGLKVALSNPCFEYWYLLHFERTSALMPTNDDVMKALKRHYPEYRKNNPESFRQEFDSRTELAITNAQGVLKEKHYGEDLRKCNPSTHVHRLVRRLREIAKG